jgi:NADP-dependent 3-hydroxy acid dehydrogenase YdfG
MNSAGNKVALVAGAGTGIGKAAAKALLGDKFKAVLTGRSLEKLNLAIHGSIAFREQYSVDDSHGKSYAFHWSGLIKA